MGSDPKTPGSALVGRQSDGGWQAASRTITGLSDATLRGVWGDDQGRVFAVGHGGLILEN